MFAERRRRRHNRRTHPCTPRSTVPPDLAGARRPARSLTRTPRRLAERLHAARGDTRKTIVPVGIPVGRVSIFPPRRAQYCSDRTASILRRRKLAASGPLPPALASQFTTGELAVLRIIGEAGATEWPRRSPGGGRRAGASSAASGPADHARAPLWLGLPSVRLVPILLKNT